MSSNEVIDTTGAEIWRVQLATGEMRAMSLDALDEAFQSGLITESTPVLPPGATSWTKLGDAAGLDDATPTAPGAPEALAETHADSMVPSIAPLAVSLRYDAETGDATPFEQRRLAAMDAIDIDALPETAFKPKKGRMFAGIGMALVLAAGVGFVGVRYGDKISASATNSLTAQQRAAAAKQAPPAAVDLDEGARRAAALSEEQKKRLAEFDKANEAREAQKKKDRPPPPPPGKARGPREKSSQPFVNGGSKYDPLNGAL